MVAVLAATSIGVVTRREPDNPDVLPAATAPATPSPTSSAAPAPSASGSGALAATGLEASALVALAAALLGVGALLLRRRRA